MPKAALNCINAIESEIKKLEYMATSFAAIQDEPWHTAGIRRIIAKQYYIYYYADEVKGYVYVINIVYSKRNQIRLLEKNSKLFLGYSEN